MPKLPLLSGAEARKVLERLGFTFLRQHGSHAIMRRGNHGCVVPMHQGINPGNQPRDVARRA